MESKRLTLEQVKADYEKTGIAPYAGVWRSKDGLCGCPMYVHYVANNPSGPFTEGAAAEWCYEVFGCKYVDDFVAGFDCPEFPVDNDGDRDGRRIREALACPIV